MAASANQLHIDITADCTSAVDAFEATKQSMRNLNRENASVSVSMSGARDAAAQMESVRQARVNASGSVNVNVNSDDVDDAQRKMGSYRQAVQGLSKDLEPIGRGKHSISLDSGSLRRASDDADDFSRQMERSRAAIGGHAQEVRAASDDHESYGRSVRASEQATRSMVSANEDAQRSFAGVSDRADDATSRVSAHEQALSRLGDTGERSFGRMADGAGDVEASSGGIATMTREVENYGAAARQASADAERFHAMAGRGGGGASMSSDRPGFGPSRWDEQQARSAARRVAAEANGGRVPSAATGGGGGGGGTPPPSKGYGGGSGGEGPDDDDKKFNDITSQLQREGLGQDVEQDDRARQTRVAEARAADESRRQRATEALRRNRAANDAKPGLNQFAADRANAQAAPAGPTYEGRAAQDEAGDRAKADARYGRAEERRKKNLDANEKAWQSTKDSSDVGRAERESLGEAAGMSSRGPGGGPPEDPPGRSLGWLGGGDDKGGGYNFAKGEHELTGRAFDGEDLSVLKGAAGPSMMGSMLGGGAALIDAMAGMAATKETVKDNPELNGLAAQAQAHMIQGVKDGAKGVNVPQATQDYKTLGDANYGLGKQLGKTGAQQLHTIVSGQSNLSQTATQGLQDAGPAIGPALRGAFNTAGAVLGGVTSPSATRGVQATGNKFADRGVADGIKKAVDGAVSAGAIPLQVIGDASKVLGNTTGSDRDPVNNAANVVSGVVGAVLGRKLGPIGMAAGSALGVTSSEQVQHGQDPTGGLMSGIGAFGLARKFGDMTKPGAALLGAGVDAATSFLPNAPRTILRDMVSGAGTGAQVSGPLAPVGALLGAAAGFGQGVSALTPGPSMPSGTQSLNYGEAGGAFSSLPPSLGAQALAGVAPPPPMASGTTPGSPPTPPAPPLPVASPSAMSAYQTSKGAQAGSMSPLDGAGQRSGPQLHTNPDGSYSLESKGTSGRTGEPYDFTDNYSASGQETSSQSQGISGKTGKPYDFTENDQNKGMPRATQDQQRPAVSPSGSLKPLRTGKELGGGFSPLTPPAFGSSGSSMVNAPGILERLGMASAGPTPTSAGSSSQMPSMGGVSGQGQMAQDQSAHQTLAENQGAGGMSMPQQVPPPKTGTPQAAQQIMPSGHPENAGSGKLLPTSFNPTTAPKESIVTAHFDRNIAYHGVEAEKTGIDSFNAVGFNTPDVDAHTGKNLSNAQEGNFGPQTQAARDSAFAPGYGPDPKGFATGDPDHPGAVSDLSFNHNSLESIGPPPGTGWGPNGEAPKGYNAAIGDAMGQMDRGLAKGVQPTDSQMAHLNSMIGDAAPKSQAPAIGPKGPGEGVGTATASTLGSLGQSLSSYNGIAAQTARSNQSVAQSFHGMNQTSTNAAQSQNEQSRTAQNQATQAQRGQTPQAVTNQNNSVAKSLGDVNSSAHAAQGGVSAMGGSLANAMHSITAMHAANPVSMASHAAGAMSAANSAISGLGASAAAAGGAMGASAGGALAAGISHSAPAAAAAGHAAGAAAASSTSKGAGTNSPSILTMQTGMWLGEGLAIGINSSAAMAAAAGSQLGAAAVSATNSAVQAGYNSTLVGGFGAGLAAASNGVTPIAQDYGLMIGYAWAENVMTGAQSVLQSSQFAALTTPQFGSKLAESTLGLEGLLPPAGSGAEYYATTSGNAGMVSMTPTVTIGSVQVSVSGTQLQGVVDQVVDVKMDQLVSSIGAQTG